MNENNSSIIELLEDKSDDNMTFRLCWGIFTILTLFYFIVEAQWSLNTSLMWNSLFIYLSSLINFFSWIMVSNKYRESWKFTSIVLV